MSVTRLATRKMHAADEADTGDGREVQSARRLDGVGADAVPGEDRLDEHRAHDQQADRDPHDGDHRRDRVAQHVPVQHLAAGHALWRGRCVRSRSPAPRASAERTIRITVPSRARLMISAGMRRCANGVDEQRPVPGEQRVDRVEAGDVQRRDDPRRQPARARRDTEGGVEDEQEHQPDPEHRQGRAEQSDDPHAPSTTRPSCERRPRRRRSRSPPRSGSAMTASSSVAGRRSARSAPQLPSCGRTCPGRRGPGWRRSGSTARGGSCRAPPLGGGWTTSGLPRLRSPTIEASGLLGDGCDEEERDRHDAPQQQGHQREAFGDERIISSLPRCRSAPA